MSCRSGSCSTRGSFHDDVRGDFEEEQCVKDVVRRIIRAQRRAVEAEEDTCFTSCDESIGELISPFEENRRRLRHNTIPFILFCREGCKPFIGSGVRRERRRRGERHAFVCEESPIFRAKSFVKGEEDCVRLELLRPVRHHHGHREHEERGEHHDRKHGEHHHEHDKHCHRKTVCDFFPDREIRDFRATGICITVDLDCFCAITCLDPITPLRARRFDEDDDC
ncbi:CotY/CotZ family spore coat protein [Pseudogracilibacillus auburnensis]|uniref:Spore coat protein Z n=2 Tax=Pseudogracilibacillus auburnensis TaxID=1494959 RepID=A0A2V3VZY1_9BACI|nr:CotY/CotZ family spore coat protein [Pseudogracilibacillus auburnensis]PXW86368.1 spore coat protein Z [Pseudogracilibacillus auburnensis]